MGRKADRQAARVAAAQERDADERWRSQWVRVWRDIGVEVGQRAGPVRTDQRKLTRGRLAAVQLLAMAAMLGAPMPRGRY